MSKQPQEIVLATYTLQLIGPKELWTNPIAGSMDLRPHGIKQPVLRETEENLNDLLPAGYSVQIREWDAEEEK